MPTSMTETHAWLATKQGTKVWVPCYACIVPGFEFDGPFVVVRSILHTGPRRCGWTHEPIS